MSTEIDLSTVRLAKGAHQTREQGVFAAADAADAAADAAAWRDAAADAWRDAAADRVKRRQLWCDEAIALLGRLCDIREVA